MNTPASTPDPMSPVEQIRCAVVEGMATVARAILGDGTPVGVDYKISPDRRSVKASAVSRELTAKALLPISEPDKEYGNYRIADTAFVVEVARWVGAFEFSAWFENNPSLAAQAIVRRVSLSDGEETWLIADSMDDERTFRGAWADLAQWAKEVVAQKWSHLPHVCIDTETRAARFIFKEGGVGSGVPMTE